MPGVRWTHKIGACQGSDEHIKRGMQGSDGHIEERHARGQNGHIEDRHARGQMNT